MTWAQHPAMALPPRASVEDYLYHTDDEDGIEYVVTRVVVENGFIVAYRIHVLHTGALSRREDYYPIYVRDVEVMISRTAARSGARPEPGSGPAQFTGGPSSVVESSEGGERSKKRSSANHDGDTTSSRRRSPRLSAASSAQKATHLFLVLFASFGSFF